MKEENKKVICNIKENTAEMYDRTITEMKKRGCSENDIKAVEDAKKETIAAYDNPPCEYIKHFTNNAINEIYPWPKDFSPLFSNLFMVRIGDVPVHLNRLLAINHDEKTLTLSSYETEKFSPLNYFLKNKKFDKLEVEYFNPQGEKVRIDTFSHIKVEKTFSGYLSYIHDDLLMTEITFKFSKYVSSAN